MAIDGVKIIDSDLGHDVYNEFMDLYDAGVEIIEIRKKLDVWRNDVLDDEEFEIFFTVYALALWETGNLDEETLNEVQKNISKKAGFKMWLEESGLTDAQAREKVLNKFLTKISTPKKTIRKRKKYKQVTNLLFQNDDVVTFQMPDQSYCAAIMAKAGQIRNNMVYEFAKTSFVGHEPPTEADIRASSVFMHKIGTSYPKSQIKSKQPGIEKFWRRDSESSAPFMLGLSYEFIEHRDLIKFVHELKVITRFKILDGFKMSGSFGYCLNFESFSERFENLMDTQINIWKHEVVALSDIEEKPSVSFAKKVRSIFNRGN